MQVTLELPNPKAFKSTFHEVQSRVASVPHEFRSSLLDKVYERVAKIPKSKMSDTVWQVELIRAAGEMIVLPKPVPAAWLDSSGKKLDGMKVFLNPMHHVLKPQKTKQALVRRDTCMFLTKSKDVKFIKQYKGWRRDRSSRKYVYLSLGQTAEYNNRRVVPGTKKEVSIGVHRLVCLLRHGNPPKEDSVASHLCDTPACCNPWHLVWKSNQANLDRKLTQVENKKQRPWKKNYIGKP